MRTSYIGRLAGILTTTLILFVACLSGCGRTIALSNSSSTSSTSADLSSSSLMFGTVTSSTSSSAQTVTLSNTGNTALNISTITLSGIGANSFNESNNCPTSLAAGNSCPITADFTPVMAGSFTAVITITDNASPSAQAIVLSGTAPPVAVSVSPATTALSSGQTAQLTATVTNTANKAVTWSSSPVGVGSISTSGLYTAPATITTAQTVTVTATSLADTTACSSTTITLEPPVAVSVSPATTALSSGQTAQLTATVTNTANKAVTWSSSPVGVGSISTSGLYTAPATITTAQTVTVTATSLADTTACSSTTITLEPSVAVSVSPATTALNSGQTAQLTTAGTNAVGNGTNQLTATVTNALNPSVTWGALLGTINPEGLYTAPSNTGSSALTDTITATSIEDPTKSVSATVTVSSDLVGWWPLDEGTGLVAYDVSGQGNDGTWNGPPSPPSNTYYTTGEIGSAAGSFGGETGLTVGTQPVYQFTGPFTLSAWVNTVSKGTILTMQNDIINGYNLAISYGIIRFCVYAGAAENCVGGGNYPLSSPTWTYFTAVFDGSNISVYANGVLLQSGNAAAPTASTGPLVFGIAQRGGDYSNFIGSIDDIRIYSRALSAGEIASLYNVAVGNPSAPTNLQAFPGNSQMGLSWNTPTAGAIVTDYVVNYRQSGTSTWTAFPHDPSVVNQRVVTGLAAGTSYDFEVMGVNSAGTGLPSHILTATPTANPPAISVSITPNRTSTISGTTTTFKATVTNALNPSVTWGALLGTINPEGLYTAPSNTGSSALTDTITATSIEDPTKSVSATVTVSSDLVGWWPLDEGSGLVAFDVSGQGNNGTWSGPPSPAKGSYYTTGEIGSAAGYFSGETSLIIGTQPVYQFTGPFTLSAWVNTVSKGTILTMQNDGINGYNLGIVYGGMRFCVYADATENCVGGGNYPLSSPTWTYFTAVFDGSNISIYTNGILLQSRNAAAPTASTGPLVIGSAQRGGDYSNFTGSIDDIRIYSRALSASEIASFYNVAVGTPNTPTNLQTFPGNSQVGLSWDTPTAGAIVTDYTVNFRQSGTNTWTAFPHNPSVVNQRVVTGLTNGTDYDFEVIPVSATGNGTASNIVTSTPTSRDSSVVASDDDEFIGPFSSWLNVKTNFGAVGDGVTDDTNAFQSALNALESPVSHASVLYIPAGTYKITSGLDYISTNCSTYCIGKSIIGESPTNTILKWQGNATGSAMLVLDGINRMQFDRLTLDGSGAQITLVNETMHQGCCYDGSNEYTDDVFENAAIGFQAGDNTVGCCSAETKVDRDTFANLTKAGISLEDWNALDWYVRYSTFEHDHYGVTNAYGEGGAIHLDHNLFEYNDIDAYWGNGSTQSYTYNTSYYSGAFLLGSPYGNSSILIGNTILMPQTAAIFIPGNGPLTLIDNTIEGTITALESSGQTITFADGSASIPNSYVTSMGNTYVSATPFSVQNVTYGTDVISGDFTSIDDAVVAISDVHAALPIMPAPLPNYHRTIYDVPQGASDARIQATIDQAIAENNGHRPVVHIPWGEYSVTSTITIPGNSDVQIVGDSTQTIINWNGSTSSPVFALLPPNHAEIRNLTINAASSSAGILVEGYDRPGDRIYTNFAAENSPGSLHNLLVSGFDNTLVQMDDFGHGGLTNSSSTSVLVVGGLLSQAGKSTSGYTGLFMGSSCCNTNSYRVEDGGTLVLTGFWYEQGGPGWLDLDGASGNFIGYEDNIGVSSGAGSLASFTANNFTGNLTISNSGFGNFDVNLAGSTPANVLLLADYFAPQAVNALVQPPVIADTNTNPNTQAATIYSVSSSGSSNFTVPDHVSAGTSHNTLIQNSLIQLASYKDPAITDLPSANEDVRLVDVIVNNGVNSFDFESVASSFLRSSHVSSAGNNAHSGMAVPSSSPTSPWGKRINKDNRAAGVYR